MTDKEEDKDFEKFKERIRTVFAPNGDLAKVTPGYVMRPAQLEFALEIADTLVTKRHLIAEAGTGTGKTFAYLVPALLYGGKVLISTAGKTLQDQLFEKDIPAVRKALAIPVKAFLLKGRSNYVCRRKLDLAINGGEAVARNREEVQFIKMVARGVDQVKTRQRIEFKGIPERARIWQDLTSQGYECNPEKCEFKDDCFVLRARSRAKDADVLVVNHHLFLADMALKNSSDVEILSSFDLIVLDEAHKLPKDAEGFFTDTLSLAEVKNTVLDTAAFLMLNSQDGAEWEAMAKDILNVCDDLRKRFTKLGYDDNFRAALADVKDRHLFEDLMEELSEKLNAFIEKIKEVPFEDDSEISPYLEQLNGFAFNAMYWEKALKSENGVVVQSAEENLDDVPRVEWLSLQPKSVNFNVTPLSFRKAFEDFRSREDKPWVATSATLSINQNFDYFASQLGLEEAKTAIWPSPFDYWNQGLLYIPPNGPDPNHDPFAFSKYVVDESWPWIKRMKGKTLFLCTSLRAVKDIGERVKRKIESEDLDFELFIQDELPRNELINRFRSSQNGIMVGSMSFWEGIDIKGQALSMVVIDKVPFTPKDEPIFRAKSEWLQEQGKSSFREIAIPEATKLLQQGVGRLIRDFNDWGIIAIFDHRLLTKGYGKQIWQALPEFRRTVSKEKVEEFLDEKGISR